MSEISTLPQKTLSALWKHHPQQLQSLSRRLCESAFTEDKNIFHEAFCDTSEIVCNWKKNLTSLIFLLDLIHNDDSTFLAEYKVLIIKKFLRNNSPISSRVMRETYNNIKGKKDARKSSFKGQFLVIYNIYTDIFLSDKSLAK